LSSKPDEILDEICSQLGTSRKILPEPVVNAASALIEAGKTYVAKELIRFFINLLREIGKIQRELEEEYGIALGALGHVLYPPIPPTPPGG